jgi:hypothetical protein
MARIRLPRSAAAITFAATVACTANPVDVCACLRATPYFVLYGEVKTPSGAAVPGAVVDLQVSPVPCRSFTARPAPVDASGTYRISFPGAEEACVRMTAMAPPELGFSDSETLEFAIVMPPGVEADSLRRDFTLHPR